MGDDAQLDAVARETLRVRPVLTMTSRKLAAPLRVGDRVLPAGVHVAPCIYLVHRRPDVYPDPERVAARALARRARPGARRRRLDPLRRRACAAAWGPRSPSWSCARCCGAVTAGVRLEPVEARGERMRRRGITLQPGAGARVVLR